MDTNELMNTVPLVGRLEWIGLSGKNRSTIDQVESAEVEVGTGLVGDHHARKGTGDRQVTLVQAEYLPVMASLLGKEVKPDDLRRNLIVSGVNLDALRERRFKVGEVELEGTGHCHPCSRMEESLGPGGHHAMRSHGGITARVISGGKIRIGDMVNAPDNGSS